MLRKIIVGTRVPNRVEKVKAPRLEVSWRRLLGEGFM
jgi:hypothetical protein